VIRLVWAARARQDVARLRGFLEKNPAAAKEAARCILRAATLLRSHPELGAPVEGEVFRDLVTRFGRGAYVLRYRIDKDAVVIARVWHDKEEREQA
jgi:plasmid stabilization system protein ParE